MIGKTKDEYADANAPGHVKAIDQWRAECMPVVDNVKLSEWSREISLIKAGLADIGYVVEEGTRHGIRQALIKLERLQASIVGAMHKQEPVLPKEVRDAALKAMQTAYDEHRNLNHDSAQCFICKTSGRAIGASDDTAGPLVRSNDEWAISDLPKEPPF